MSDVHPPSEVPPYSPLSSPSLECVRVCVCMGQSALVACFIWIFWSSGEADLAHPALHCQGPEQSAVAHDLHHILAAERNSNMN